MPISDEKIELRKSSLVAAARALIREKGGSGFSMRELATKARVAPATPYNLLSTKANLLAMVVHEEFKAFRLKMEKLTDLSGLDRLLATIELLSATYVDDQKFYFGFLAAAGTAGENSLGPILMQESRTLFLGLVQAAVPDEHQRGQLNLGMITDVLLRTMRATVEAWYVDNWSNSYFKAVFAYSALLVLLPTLEGNSKDRIRAELMAIQSSIEA